MADADSSTRSQNIGGAQLPHLTNTPIEDLGLTLLATGGLNPSLDIIFVHGLQGHPEHTWTYHRKAVQEPPGKNVRPSKLKFWKPKADKANSTDNDTEVGRDGDTTYWPNELLAHDLPTARIFTYGYDSSVSHFFNGPANQNSITDNGRALLSSIASQRHHCLGRPLLLIVHSLGGIVVKSVRPLLQDF